MTNEKFLQEVEKFKLYLKPELYQVLVMVSEVLSEDMRVSMIKDLEDADLKMNKIALYQQRRVSILQKGLNKFKQIYKRVKKAYSDKVKDEESLDRSQAEEIIANI